MGKTTAFRIIGTFIKLTSGTARIFDTDIVKDPSKIRETIIYLPKEAGAYRNLSGFEYLNFMENFYRKNVRETVDEGALPS